MGRAIGPRSVLLTLLIAGLVLAGCNRDKNKKDVRMEAPIAASAIQAAAPKPAPVEPLPPATAAEVRSALGRIFGDAVQLDESVTPAFFTGDFNGDGSQDVMAVVLVSSPRLAQVNDELANWTIANPRHTWLPPAGARVVRLPDVNSNDRETVAAGERLLAVIHGVDAQGWRNGHARQAYLLREVAGDISATMHLRHLPKQANPGDVLREKVGAESGFLYWSGAKYVWQKGAPAEQRTASASARVAAAR